jgi:hypothetical protein
MKKVGQCRTGRLAFVLRYICGCYMKVLCIFRDLTVISLVSRNQPSSLAPNYRIALQRRLPLSESEFGKLHERVPGQRWRHQAYYVSDC